MTTRNRNVLLVALVPLLGACLGGGRFGLVSTEDEVAFGAEAHAQLLQEYRECSDCRALVIDPARGTTITAYVEALGQELARAGNPERGEATYQIPQWTFTVLDSDEINAFALPGGFLYVTTGLLSMVDNKAELAGILGHEVGHVTHYHGVNRLETFMIAAGLGTAIFGEGSAMAELAQTFVGALDSFVSSQDAELEADSAGVRYAFANLFNPLEMNRFFEAIRADYDAQDPVTSSLSAILSSHPHPRDRIARVNEEALSLGVTGPTTTLREDDPAIPYTAVRAALASRPAPATEGSVALLPPRVQRALRTCLFDPEQRILRH